MGVVFSVCFLIKLSQGLCAPAKKILLVKLAFAIQVLILIIFSKLLVEPILSWVQFGTWANCSAFCIEGIKAGQRFLTQLVTPRDYY